MHKFLTIIIRSFLLLACLNSFLLIEAADDQAEELLKQIPPDQRNLVRDKMEESDSLTKELEEIFEDPLTTLVERPEDDEDARRLPECDECIFGYDFFRYSPSTFAPTDNISISSDYILGPGDKLEVSFYGNDQKIYKGYISREGILNTPLLGPINLLGLSFSDAKELIEKKVETELIGTEVFLSLQELRSISVYLLGQAHKPGKYTMSGLSTITNALFVSGGVNKEGSLRNIQIKRGNKIIRIFDFYDFLLSGSLETDVRLIDGDVIFIPFIENKVKLGGAFKRPDLYEFIPGETIQDAVKLAGGLKSDVVNSQLEISSVDRDLLKRQISYTDINSQLKLKDLDSINVNSTSGLQVKTIKVSGEVNNPGEYSIQDGDTILDILDRAGGYTEESYPEGALFLRKSTAKEQKEGFLRTADELENTMVNIITEGTISNITEFSLTPLNSLILRLRSIDPVGRQVADLTWLALKTDPFKNFKVQDGDELIIPQRPNSVTVLGEVLNPSTLRYEPSFSLDEYIAQSGGLSSQADRERILIILPNGKAVTPKSGLFKRNVNLILPGSTIVVTRDSKTWDAIKLTSVITPILANLATSAAAIAAISD